MELKQLDKILPVLKNKTKQKRLHVFYFPSNVAIAKTF